LETNDVFGGGAIVLRVDDHGFIGLKVTNSSAQYPRCEASVTVDIAIESTGKVFPGVDGVGTGL